MNTSDDGNITRRRRRKHSAEFKAKVVSACRKPGVSIAAVALANRLNANLLRRWVVAEEQAPSEQSDRDGQCGACSVERRERHVHSDPGGELCGHDGAGDHDRAAAWRDGGEGRLAVGRGGRLRGLVA